MHLKSKLVRSELRSDAPGVQTSQRSSLFMSQQEALLRTCSSNHGNVSGRLPLSVISANTLCCSSVTNNNCTVASLCLKAPPGCENDALGLYQTAAGGGDTPLDIWTIKPGHVREKIAIFAPDAERRDDAGGSERLSAGSNSQDRTLAVCTNHSAMTGLFRAVKAKGSWEENCTAKRRRRSGDNQNLRQDHRSWVQDSPSPRRSDSTQLSNGGVMATEEEEQKVSVVEMVAFLEQRASEQQPDKPVLVLQRSSTTITLSRAPPPEGNPSRAPPPPPWGEEPESVKVLDMVAKLESECLRRRRTTEGDLSRSNSLRRMVGRVLLAAGDQNSSPCQPSSVTSSPLSEAQSVSGESPATALTTPPSGEEAETLTEATPPPPEETEPLPGLLFLSPDSKPHLPHHRMTFDLQLAGARPRPPPAHCDSSTQSEKRRRKTDRVQEEVCGISLRSGAAPPGRRASASNDFLLMRQRLQQLLEPQPYLSVLPHHLLLKILLLLPTQSLAALKCSCHYFRFIIDTYAVRPADSLWVSDPRYRDDPCKQCKRRYGRGDVSLCRWHHKPYCQALPYGPGYWMCCHGAHRDAPGCNVGLHDNRWVPAFHSINMPIYRRSRHDD